MRIKTERSIMRLSLIFLGICFFSNYTYSQDYHEIKFENADQLGSAWYGGDLRTPGSERNIGSGESVLIDTSMQIDSFSLYIGGFNNVDSAKLVLDVRNDNGVIIASDTILIKTSFGSDWITWTNLNLSVLKGTILRFTSYVLNGGVTGFRGSIRGDVGENYPFGKRQDRRATRLEGPPPFDMISWDLWFDSSWDMWFWAQGTTLTPREQDSLALVDLYNNTDGPNWTDNTNWLSAELIDNWVGVTVLDNRVVFFNLFNNKLKGVISY